MNGFLTKNHKQSAYNGIYNTILRAQKIHYILIVKACFKHFRSFKNIKMNLLHKPINFCAREAFLRARVPLPWVHRKDLEQ